MAVGLDGVAEGVAEIEYMPDSMVVRVVPDDTVLDASHLLQLRFENRRSGIAHKHLIQSGICHRRRLHHLHLPVNEFLPRQRVQKPWFYAY